MKYRLFWVGVALVGGILGSRAQNNSDYDYFELNLRWPNSFCAIIKDSCRDEVPQQFTIASFRPVKRMDPDLGYCNSSYTLSDDTLTKYKSELMELWPVLTTDSFEDSEDSWSAQWDYYGSCSDGTLNPEEYIVTALNRGKDLDPKKILKNAGIEANGNQYPSTKILEAMRNEMGVDVDILCGNSYLSQILVCFDYYGKELRDCEIRTLWCKDDLIYPPPDASNNDAPQDGELGNHSVGRHS